MLSKFILFFSIIISLSFGQNNFFNVEKEGWFWYEANPTNIDQNKTLEDDKFIASVPLNALDKMTAEEFQKTFEKVRSIAVMKPTFENVQTMRIMQKFMTDQSMKFTKVFEYAKIVDPDNNYNNIGTGGFSNNSMKNQKELEKKAKYLTDDVVFVTFVRDQTSELARTQIVKNLDFRGMGIDARTFEYTTLDDQKLVKRLNIKEDIENFVFKRSSKEWTLIRKTIIDPAEFIKDYMFYEEYKNEITHNKNFIDEFNEKLGEKK